MFARGWFVKPDSETVGWLTEVLPGSDSAQEEVIAFVAD